MARFKAEARLAASLEHPNIVPIHRGGEEDGVLYLAMRFVPGTNLRQVIDRGPMDLPRVARIIDRDRPTRSTPRTRAGWSTATSSRPTSCVSGAGEHEHVYLTDFGLTKRLGSVGDAHAHRRLGRHAGLRRARADPGPRRSTAAPTSTRSAACSTRCSPATSRTRRTPTWPSSGRTSPIRRRCPARQRPSSSQAFDEVVARATAKDPDDRYPTAGDLAAAVRRRRRRAGGQAPRADASRDTSEGRTPREASPAPSRRRTRPAPGAAPTVAAGAPRRRPSRRRAAAEPAGCPRRPRRRPATPPGRAAGRPAAPGGGGRRRRRARGDRRPSSLAAALPPSRSAILLLDRPRTSDSGADAAPRPRRPARRRATSGRSRRTTSTGTGDAIVRLNGDVATVTVNDERPARRRPHAMHIHAGAKGVCPPTQAAHDAQRPPGRSARSTACRGTARRSRR